MDKTTKTQLSIALFIIGFLMIFVQDLKRLDSINLGFGGRVLPEIEQKQSFL